MLDQTGLVAAAFTPAGSASDSAAFGARIIHLTGAQTGGALSLWEEIVAPGAGAPLHIHHREDEAFLVLEGRLRIWCAGAVHDLEPGAAIALPRGVPHRFENPGPGIARALVLCTPGGFDGFFRELDAIPGFGPEAIAAAAARHGLEFVGA
jgi:mannose-6-phosphate isomerase-like protein (cupin superfamily)